MISIYLSFLIILIAAISFLKNLWQNELFVMGFIIGFYVLVTFTTIAIFASAMQLCWKRVSATQFALYMAISNLGLAAGVALLGQLIGFFDWEYVILSYIIYAGVMLVLIRFINFEKHQGHVDGLESKFLEN